MPSSHLLFMQVKAQNSTTSLRKAISFGAICGEKTTIMSHRRLIASSHSSSAFYHRERNEHEVLQHDYKVEEARRIVVKLEHNDLAQ